jgi:hypothetical protein
MKGLLPWLVLWALHVCLGCSSRPSAKYLFPHRTLFQFICHMQLPSKLGRQSCCACLLMWQSSVGGAVPEKSSIRDGGLHLVGRKEVGFGSWEYETEPLVSITVPNNFLSHVGTGHWALQGRGVISKQTQTVFQIFFCNMCFSNNVIEIHCGQDSLIPLVTRLH